MHCYNLDDLTSCEIFDEPELPFIGRWTGSDEESLSLKCAYFIDFKLKYDLNKVIISDCKNSLTGVIEGVPSCGEITCTDAEPWSLYLTLGQDMFSGYCGWTIEEVDYEDVPKEF